MRTSAQDWASSIVVPGPGDGTLARIGPVVLLVGSSDPDVVRPYVDHAAMVAANGGQGRQLVRGYAMLLSTATDDSPGFAALAPHDTGLSVFVDGDVTVTVDDTVISGADSLAWVERLVPWPVGSVTVALPGATTPDPGSPYRLHDGVVPAGALLVTGPAAEPADDSMLSRIAEVEEMRATQPPPPPPPSPPPTADSIPVVPPAPGQSSGRPLPPPYVPEEVSFQSVLLDDLDDESFEPLPIVDDSSQVARAREPLGVVVLDDGSVYQLDVPYLLGRDPASDERVRSGAFRALPVIDTSNQVSRVHARVELRGPDAVLVDNVSTNGTYVHVPQTDDWMRMPPGGELVLVHGTRVRIGHRTLAFDAKAR
ncbi:hypothetical protein HNR19_003002 [Nocardioides thalensis]|uniref:FHA domain-containing protein n=1 Tax=Nocardioides thalensis TaxID=1914755 RepID=A0A853C4C7_9ACTN|nr:hypothetical protein [Nocardioides thalensis]